MPSERGAMRRVPLATPFGRLAHERGGIRGVLLSAAVHLGVVALLLWGGSRFVLADRAPGPGHGRGGGGGGGNRTLVLLVAPPPPVAQPAPPAPEPQVILPTQLAVVVPAPQPDTVPHPPAGGQPAAGPGAGSGLGPGTGPGSGTGSGGGSGSGVGPGTGPDSGGGGTIFQAQPQGIIMPPVHPPSSLRGTAITAVFEISESGEVVHVALDPMPRDHKFASDFLDRLRRYTFSPAHTVDGRPVPALFRITFTL